MLQNCAHTFCVSIFFYHFEFSGMNKTVTTSGFRTASHPKKAPKHAALDIIQRAPPYIINSHPIIRLSYCRIRTSYTADEHFELSDSGAVKRVLCQKKKG